MAYPYTFTNAVDGFTEIEAAHLNNLEQYVGLVGSDDTDCLTYKLTNSNQVDPGHKHTHAALSGTMGVDGDILHKASGAWSPKSPDAAGIVDKSTSQTIGGAKTFTVIPILPGTDPTQANEAARKGYVDTKVSKAGDTMTGPLVLPGDPTSNLQAAPKQYVDAQVNTRVAKAGDTMTGALTLSGDPTQNLHAATKQYVDNSLSGYKPSKLWESDGGAEAIDVDASGILKIPSKVAPSSSQTDAALVWAEDVNGEAGKSGLHMMNEALSGVKLIVPGVYLKTSTGDPTSYFEGMLVINTVDNTLKIYADGGFRQLATWT